MAEEADVKVMLVDDDTFLLDMYALKFKERGTSVEANTSVQQALTRIAEGFTPDLLVVDVIMPEMNGFDLLKKIQEENAIHPVIVVLSNQGQDEDLDRAKKLGAHGYIIKANTMPSEVVAQCFDILKKQQKANLQAHTNGTK